MGESQRHRYGEVHQHGQSELPRARSDDLGRDGIGPELIFPDVDEAARGDIGRAEEPASEGKRNHVRRRELSAQLGILLAEDAFLRDEVRPGPDSPVGV